MTLLGFIYNKLIPLFVDIKLSDGVVSIDVLAPVVVVILGVVAGNCELAKYQKEA